ncbi:MAG TPA: hypothetical protein VHX38_38385 [Pseudonocardiaceae bacterium]|nr:hypothetical protein [Pseudonocardiaceae bacterium]
MAQQGFAQSWTTGLRQPTASATPPLSKPSPPAIAKPSHPASRRPST